MSHHLASTYSDHGRDQPTARGFSRKLRQSLCTAFAFNAGAESADVSSKTEATSVRKSFCSHFSKGKVNPIFGRARKLRGRRSANASASSGSPPAQFSGATEDG